MTLYLIGMGLWDAEDISVKGLRIAKACDRVYVETYTRLFEDWEGLRRLLGKEPIRLARSDMEEDMPFLEGAKDDDVALLVPGDPLVATTHKVVVDECIKRGIPWRVIHSSSIYTAAVGRCGLHVYRMGPPCTIPSPDKRIRPYSVYDKIVDNLKRDLHTLVFLDTEPAPLKPSEAAGILLDIERERGERVLSDAGTFVVCRLGSEDERIRFIPLRDVEKTECEGPCVMIITAPLHFSEGLDVPLSTED